MEKVNISPEYFAHLVGHQRQILGIQRMVASGRFPGLLLLSGPLSVDREAIARACTAAILCTSLEALDRHPDVLFLHPEMRDNGTKIYDVTVMRDLVVRLNKTAILGRTVVIMNDADALNIAAQNVLLKTLEESPGRTTLILITQDAMRLLPTVRSRGVTISFVSADFVTSESLSDDVQRFTNPSLVERLKIAQALGKREGMDYEAFFTFLVKNLHDTEKYSAKILSSILQARERIAGYGNSTVALEELAIQLH